MSDKEQTIYKLWELSGHGTRREDVEAAYKAGAIAERAWCISICKGFAQDAARLSCAEASVFLEKAVLHLQNRVDLPPSIRD